MLKSQIWNIWAWAFEELNTSSNTPRNLGVEVGIMASSRKHEDMQGMQCKPSEGWISLTYRMLKDKVIHEKYDVLLNIHDNMRIILKFS